jgi:hypothetical protein
MKIRSAKSEGSEPVARVAQSEAKICAGKEYLLCEPRARYLNTWGSDHVERSPTPTVDDG